MNTRVVQDLVYHITRRAKDEGVFDVGATKLTKLLYLVDCEFFRWNRRTATEAPWIFYHFGPYSSELLDAARQTPGVRFEDPIEFDGEKTFRACELGRYRADPIEKAHFTFRGIVDGVLKRWLGSDLPTILNHVYFHTEPMANARRGEPLDFSQIPQVVLEFEPCALQQPPSKRDFLASIATQQRLRRRLAEKREALKQRRTTARVELDEDLIEAMRMMDAEDVTDFPDTRVALNEGA